MATSNYLNSILKIMPAIQARQIADLLSKLKVSGEVRNAEEYAAKLQELSTLINDQNPIPSFNQISSGIWYVCESAAHNAMMTALKNDLEALFLQVDEIGMKVNDHHFLVMKNLAADLERGLADQENKIRRLEWLAGQDNEFSLALVNSFVSASSFKIPRSDSLDSVLYFDNRTYTSKTEDELPSAVVDDMGEKLVLGVSNDPIVYPVSVRQLNDEYSYGTEEDVDTQKDLTNLIDGTRGTYWTRNVYLSAPVPKVTTVLEFDLGTGKDINYISIEAASSEAFIIEDIKGVCPDGSLLSLIDSSLEISGKTRIDFNRVFIKAFQITFAMYSYNKAEYFIPDQFKLNEVINPYTSYKKTVRTVRTDSIQNVATVMSIPSENKSESVSNTNLTKSISTRDSLVNIVPSDKRIDRISLDNDLGPIVREVLVSENLSDLLNITKPVKRTQINSFSYTIALDNVWAGNSKYASSGIFVSKPLAADNIGVLAINTFENTIDADSANSIEYQIIKRDKYPFFKEVNFPIPSLGQTDVVSERLMLTKKESRSDFEDAGKLRFCPYVKPDWTVVDPVPILVYENGNELLLGADYEYAIKTVTSSLGQAALDWEGTNFISAANLDNYKLETPKLWIKILRPNSSSIYTVDYEIRTSDSYMTDKNLYLDVDKTIFLSDGGRVRFRRDNLNATIKSDIYLQITLRRNVATQSKSPELLEYAILGATYNN